MNTLLAHLATDDFADSIGFILPPAPLRSVLQQSPDVRRLESAFRYGQISEDEIRRFVDRLLKEYRSGEVFRYDIVLAALAVAMEHWNHPLAEEYLLELARIQHAEFRASFRVARECLKARFAFPKTEVRTSRYPQGGVSLSSDPHGIRPMPGVRWGECRGVTIRWFRYAEAVHARA